MQDCLRLAVFNSSDIRDHKFNPGTDGDSGTVGIAAGGQLILGGWCNAHTQLGRTIDGNLGEAVSDFAVAESAEEGGAIVG